MAGLEDIVGWFLPITKKVSTNEYMQIVAGKDQAIGQYIQQDPGVMAVLEKAVKETEDNYRFTILAAKGVDTLDKLGVGATMLGWLGLGPGGILTKIGASLLDLTYKTPFALGYAARTGDIGALPGWGLNEVGSLIPGLGILDARNNYINRTYDCITDKMKGVFHEKLKHYKHQKHLDEILERGINWQQYRPVQQYAY